MSPYFQENYRATENLKPSSATYDAGSTTLVDPLTPSKGGETASMTPFKLKTMSDHQFIH
ncbi:hypothetical protein TSUD_235150 [Trifolium subterraneum]|uniref:Uncharacterized protein n=1 Tax=Trifolium subterraneum TaxID=3900 RepID=A0A2Z6LYR2_TRISU|nr:hypothetical protein TSUD_235150 [Trifolium subterraneum]